MANFITIQKNAKHCREAKSLGKELCEKLWMLASQTLATIVSNEFFKNDLFYCVMCYNLFVFFYLLLGDDNYAKA